MGIHPDAVVDGTISSKYIHTLGERIEPIPPPVSIVNNYHYDYNYPRSTDNVEHVSESSEAMIIAGAILIGALVMRG